MVNTMPSHESEKELSISNSVPKAGIYILDDDENPVGTCQTGLLWLGSAAAPPPRASLYLPESTAKRYKYDPFEKNGSFMYNTGALCCWRADGSIAYLGRQDEQGRRVKLESIAASMEEASFITKACAIFSEGLLWGFYSGSPNVDVATIKAFVAERLPEYAVPSKFVFRETLPLKPNGKFDRRALLASVGTYVASSPPDTPVEPDLLASWILEKEKAQVYIREPERSLAGSLKLEGDHLVGAAVTVTPPASAMPPAHLSSEKEMMQAVVTTPVVNSPSKIELPGKKGVHGLRSIRHKIFSLYRWLFSFAFIANLMGMVLMWKFSKAGRGLQNACIAEAVNLFMVVLMRQEYFINALYRVACLVPTSWPFWIRKRVANIYHIGGIHSGCAISALVWLIIFTVGSTINRPDVAVLTVSYLILALMTAMIVTAHPAMRKKYHDSFEMVHRFAGWTVVALFWAQTVVVANSFREDTVEVDANGVIISNYSSLGSALLKSPGMWLLSMATFSIILPWLHLRKVTVRTEFMSKSAVRLYFNYTRNPRPGTAIRISTRPLLEWHAFATIAKPGENEFSILIANAGDWTSKQIEKGPSKMWVRGIPTSGVVGITPLFRSVLLVATGSGIGPCLPVIYAKKVRCHIFWSAPNPESTFGPEIINSITECYPQAVIHNTKTMGRPDMVAMTYRMFKESGAEAVVIISNQKLTQLVVYGMESRGIPAYGAIFDS
ncbi:uncharacterized protein L3040_008053 [Drepanopeziza brunnea f. sp. 'multigermtubi']|uniref:Nonribosomal peptide synthetase 12 n=1 Tax=Marssonina brunnea f. sp. multigermtubi (strain MB_m1) TaxID=1072389 RepID=K1XY81_MARBU|nr:nonribosomal peptide synthetase 12 [Drepanopeziza brunnea f. sp. 'multigermtubi' MB_m1]EKD17764.1 nonribosomal peptide synthetase 12 [Drepanopeziza brunnea f. sp. 'multigermtubi' MB_m1]KAJ5035588.1 hypothetical protein L3040_008053 [Drepanopeziza brunnea f. sp. 'multigermtubi']